jgi:hypothetical protein
MQTDHWEMVSGSMGARVRRMSIPGGWLYQVESVRRARTITSEFPDYEIVSVGWGQPVFVPITVKLRSSRVDDLAVTRVRDGYPGSMVRRALLWAVNAPGGCWALAKRAFQWARRRYE